MTSKIDDFAAEQARFEKIFDDLVALKNASAYCVIGRHDVPRDQVTASPKGSNVCKACQQTRRGKTEMADFDPCA